MIFRNVVFLIAEGEYTFTLPAYVPAAELEPFEAATIKPKTGDQLGLFCGDFACSPVGFWWKVYPPVIDQPTAPLGEIHYPCTGFADWLATLPAGLPRQQATTGTGRLALMCFERFQTWVKPLRAQQAIEMIEAGDATFDSLREDLPDVFEVPAFNNYLAQRFAANTMPTARVGKRRSIKEHSAKRELYLLACRIEREEQPITWIAACAAALMRAPALVKTARWHVSENAADNLRREGDRYFGKTRWGAYRLQDTPAF